MSWFERPESAIQGPPLVRALAIIVVVSTAGGLVSGTLWVAVLSAALSVVPLRWMTSAQDRPLTLAVRSALTAGIFVLLHFVFHK